MRRQGEMPTTVIRTMCSLYGIYRIWAHPLPKWNPHQCHNYQDSPRYVRPSPRPSLTLHHQHQAGLSRVPPCFPLYHPRRHVVLAVHHHPSQKWGSLGISRREELAYKVWRGGCACSGV